MNGSRVEVKVLIKECLIYKRDFKQDLNKRCEVWKTSWRNEGMKEEEVYLSKPSIHSTSTSTGTNIMLQLPTYRGNVEPLAFPGASHSYCSR